MSKELCYKIEIDEDTNHREYFLNDEPWTFIDPKRVTVGCIVHFDKDAPSKSGIVTNVRESDFIYYDVGHADSLLIEEVAMFQVFDVECTDEKCSEAQ